MMLMEQLAKTNKNIQNQIAALMARQDQGQLQAQVQPNVGTQVVIQSKDKDPNAM